jgi:prepilin-type N-terminal cleavage/methylation domain-containing protein
MDFNSHRVSLGNSSAFAIVRFVKISQHARYRSSGLTLIELLVSLLIISFSIVAASSLIGFGAIGLKGSDSNYETQNLIDQNLSLIESAADRYVCNYANSNKPCVVLDSLPAKGGYVNPNSLTYWPPFKRRCEQKDYPNSDPFLLEDLITPLVNAISDPTPTNPAFIPSPPGIYRGFTVHGSGSTLGIGRIKHFTVTYRKADSTGVILRDATIVPTIVSYCP